MYRITIICCVLFALSCMVNAQQGSCITAYAKQGRCIAINECPSLSALTRPDRTQQDIDLLKRSHCGFIGQTPAVCCPIQPPAAKCYTPDGNPGQCIDINSCPNLQNLLQKPVDTNKLQYVERSKCDGPDTYSVCCGPVPEIKPAVVGQCENRVTAFPPDPATECCGFDSRFDNKIYGGSATTVDEYPWLALIEYDQNGAIKTLCGGALISGRYVLTAGHCVLGPILNIAKPKNVRLAEYDTGHEGADCAPSGVGGMDCTTGITRIPIEKLIPYPEYSPPQKKHDIALIRMAQMAPFTDFIRPICLPRSDVNKITTPFNVTAAGWGAISWDVRSSPIKLQVELPYVQHSQCQSVYHTPGRYVNLWKGQICAGGVAGKDACKGDSGGPLMYENGRSYEVIGLVSFGPKYCGQQDVPGIYTHVYEYNPWIRSNIVP